MDEGLIAWSQDSVAGVPLRRLVGRVGAIAVAAIEWDASNRLWTWSSPLAEDVWGHAPSECGAKQAVELWLRSWLENFRPFFQ
jgi:hypothetical protein